MKAELLLFIFAGTAVARQLDIAERKMKTAK